MKAGLAIFFLLVLLGRLESANRKESPEDLISTHVFKGYNQFERPLPVENSTNHGRATEVIVYIQILSITSVNVKSMQFTLDMYLRQKWTDKRLAWDHLDEFKDHKNFITSIENKKKSWIPDLFFRNGKVGRIHNMTCENMLFRIWPNGNILFSQKITMTFSCAMDFSTFPMDTQTCVLNIGSYGYTTDELVFMWMPKTNDTAPIKYQKQLQIPEFATPEDIPVKDCTNSSGQSTGTYSCLMAQITLERQIGWWLANTFVPNILVVMVSWLNFWISLEAVPARVTLGFLTLLVTITQSVSKGSPLPRVSYIKAIDVWTMACIVFNVSVLVEYALASNMARKSRDLSWKKEVRDTVREEITKWCNACLNQYNLRGRPAPLAYHNQTPLGYVNSAAKAASSIKHGNLKFSNEIEQFLLSQDITFDDETKQAPSQNPAAVESAKDNSGSISVIDKRSRIGFPLMFALFNLCYWSYYLVYMKDYNKTKL